MALAVEMPEQSSAASPSSSSTSPGACGREQMAFWGSMWDRFDDVCQRRVEPSRRLLEVFTAALQERAQVERLYSRGLMQSAARLQRIADEEQLPVAMDAVLTNMRNRSEQSNQLAEDIDFDVAAILDVMLQQHADVSRKVFLDGKKLTRYWQDAKGEYNIAAARYVKACSDAEEVAHAFNDAVHLPQRERTRIAENVMKAACRATIAEETYQRSLQKMNTAIEVYERQMSLVLGALQDMEEKRAQCLHDTTMKLAVYDTAWLRNVQYDLEAVVKTVESEGPYDTLQEFIRQNQSSAPPPRTTPRRCFWELSGAKTLPPPATTAENGRLEGDEAVARPLLRLLLQAGGADAGLGAPELAEQATAIAALCERLKGTTAAVAPVNDAGRTAAASPSGIGNEEVKDHDRNPGAAGTASAQGGAEHTSASTIAEGASAAAVIRLHLCDALKAEIEKLQVDMVCLPSAEFEAISRLFAAALDGCDFECDWFSGQKLLVLSKLIMTESDGHPVSVLLKVYSHPLWSRVTFWEDTLCMALADAYARHALARRSTASEARSIVDEAPITPFLRGFATYMMDLGIKPSQASSCVQKTLRKQAALLGAETAEKYVGLLTHDLHAAGVSQSSPPAKSVSPAVASSAPVTLAAAPPTSQGLAAATIKHPSGPRIDSLLPKLSVASASAGSSKTGIAPPSAAAATVDTSATPQVVAATAEAASTSSVAAAATPAATEGEAVAAPAEAALTSSVAAVATPAATEGEMDDESPGSAI